jgi:hypothetical protein
MTETASVLIAGDYVDAYLYGGLLLAWDSRGRLMIASTESLADVVSSGFSIPRRSARAAFVDNKLLSIDEAKSSPGEFGFKSLRSADGDVAHVDINSLDCRFFSVADDAVVFDLMATYGHLFISTDEALLSVPFGPFEVGTVEKRIAHRCLSASPRWGAVSASCADKGAWALLGEIGYGRDIRKRTEQIDEKESVRHAWTGSTFLSFSGDNDIDLYTAAAPVRKGQHRIVETFDPVDDSGEWGSIWQVAIDSDASRLRDADFVTAVTGLLIVVGNGRLTATQISTWSRPVDGLYRDVFAMEIGDRVLSLVETASGLVVETDSSLLYLDDQELRPLISRETISLRSYPRSKRHRRTITATVDGGLLVTAVFGENSVRAAT